MKKRTFLFLCLFLVSVFFNSLFPFEPIAFVKGSGNSNTMHAYNYRDPNVLLQNQNNIYYRLNQKDLDGNSTYTQIINWVQPELAYSLTVWPNPTNDILNINCLFRSNCTTYSGVNCTT